MPLVPNLRVGGWAVGPSGAEVAVGTNNSVAAPSVYGTVAQGSGPITTSPASLAGAPQPTTPAVPATTVAATNSNPYSVNVVVTGGTLTVVSVNGVTVGTTDGTYTVPGGGTIAITYSVQPTWAWSNANAVPGGVNTATTYGTGVAVPTAVVSAT